jgi:hypothetical protein
MPFDFPSPATNGQVYTPAGGPSYMYSGGVWKVSVSGSGGGGAATVVDVSPPPNPDPGGLWWDSDSGRLYIFYDDGNTQQWVEVVPPVGASKDYVDSKVEWYTSTGPPVSEAVRMRASDGEIRTEFTTAGSNVYTRALNVISAATDVANTSGIVYFRDHLNAVRGYLQADHAAESVVILARNAAGATASFIRVNDEGLNLSKNLIFPVAQVASANPNALDDYEEGVFTPTIVGSTTAGTGTYSSQLGRYTKVGNRVTADGTISFTGHTGTGNMVIGGMPFTGASTFGAISAGYCSNITFTGQIVFVMATNSTNLAIQAAVSNTSVANVQMDTGGVFSFSMSYQVA